MSKVVPVDIKVKFGKAIVKLENHKCREKTAEGVEIWIKPSPANNFQAMAEIPDGTLEKYMHCRPEIIACDWVAA